MGDNEQTTVTTIVTTTVNSLKLVVTIEGNIACGKSTLLECLKDFNSVTVLPEPIEKWRNWNSVNMPINMPINMLQLLYDNPKKYMKDFQIMGQITLAENHNLVTVKHKIMERSIYTGMHVFTMMAYHDGNLTYDEMKEVLHCFEHTKQNIIQPDIAIYLRTSPEVCYDRLKKRNRAEEAGVTLEYLKRLHDYHEELFIRNQELLPCPVIVLNANKDPEEVKVKFVSLCNFVV